MTATYGAELESIPSIQADARPRRPMRCMQRTRRSSCAEAQLHRNLVIRARLRRATQLLERKPEVVRHDALIGPQLAGTSQIWDRGFVLLKAQVNSGARERTVECVRVVTQATLNYGN